MNAERLTELAALNAVGALDGDELREFETLAAAADPSLTAKLASLRDAAALMAVATSPSRRPSSAAKAGILARLESRSPRPSPQTTKPFFFVGRTEGRWETMPISGVRFKDLSVDARRGVSVKLYELAPGVRFPGHHHSGPEECYVVFGDFHVERRVLHGGDFHHAECDTDHGESFTENGCTLLVMVTSGDWKYQ